MDCKHCAYCNRCKHPNESKPACLMKTRYDKAVVMARVPKRYRNSFPTNIPIQESNPEGYRKVIKYCKSILMYVEEGLKLAFQRLVDNQSFAPSSGDSYYMVTYPRGNIVEVVYLVGVMVL